MATFAVCYEPILLAIFFASIVTRMRSHMNEKASHRLILILQIGVAGYCMLLSDGLITSLMMVVFIMYRCQAQMGILNAIPLSMICFLVNNIGFAMASDSTSTLQQPDVSVDQHDAPVWVDALFMVLMLLVHIVYAIKFSNFALQYLHAKCGEIEEKGQHSITRIFLRSVSTDKEKWELEKYADEGVNFTELWMQMSLLRNLLRIIIFLSLIISLILWVSLFGNILFEYLVTCMVSAYRGKYYNLLALLVLPLTIFAFVGFVRFVFQSMSIAWSTIMDQIGDQMGKQQNIMTVKRKALQDAIASLPKKQSLDTSTKVDEDHKNLLKTFHAPYWIAVHWRLWWMGLCVGATILAVSRTQSAYNMGDSFVLKLFLRYMMMSAIEWNVVYFLSVIIISIYGHVVNLAIFGVMYDHDEADEALIERQNRNDHKCTQKVLRFFCLLDAFGVDEDDDGPWMKFKFTFNGLIVSIGFICIIAASFTGNSLARFIGIMLILYYCGNIILACKPRGIYYLWKYDEEALELEADDDAQYAHHDTFHGDRKVGTMKKMLSRNFTLQQLSQEIDVDASDFIDDDINNDESKPYGANLVVGNGSHDQFMSADDENDSLLGKKKQMKIVVSDADDFEEEKEEKLFLLDDDDGNENKNKKRDSRKKKKGRKMTKDDDAMDIFMHLYKKLHNNREQHVLEWKEETEFGSFSWYQRIFRKSTFLVALNYIVTLCKYYKIYWLLILPYNYEIRPYSMTCGGESMIENCFKYPCKETKIWTMIYDVGKYCWHAIKGCCCALGVFFALIISLYVTVFLSNQIDPVDATNNHLTEGGIILGNNTNNASNFESQDISKLYPICELSWYGDLSVLDLTFLIQLVYEIAEPGTEQPVPLNELLSLYFYNTTDTDIDIGDEWQIVHYTREEPVFMHLRNIESGSDIISVRGTASKLDMLQDLSLYMSIALLQTFSLIIPITSIAPTSFTIKMVWIASYFEGIVDDSIRDSYDTPVYNYAYNVLATTEDLHSLYIVGHSLGGGISQAVAAQLYYMNQRHLKKNVDIKSLSIAAPGMLFGSKKFNFDLEALYMTSIVIKPQHDLVSNIDVHGGLLQNLECNTKSFAECHLVENILCELYTHCHHDDCKNPKMYDRLCELAETGEKARWTYTYDAMISNNNNTSPSR